MDYKPLPGAISEVLWREGQPLVLFADLVAARREALEEAAKACEALPASWPDWRRKHMTDEEDTVQDCAAAIRALIPKEQ